LITNFHLLPHSLECLNLRQASVHTEDFAQVLDLPNLKCLGLLSYNNTRNFGVTYDLYTKLLRKRSLDEMFISKFTYEDPAPTTRVKLRMLMDAMKSRVNKLKETAYLGYLDSCFWKFNLRGHYLHSVTGRAIRMT